MRNQKIDSKKLLSIASDLAKNAATLLSPLSRTVLTSFPRDVKVDADIQLNRMIQSGLKEFSSFPILSEENTLPPNLNLQEPLWIIDPLDGSLNHSKNIPFCCISIGLWKEGKPHLGVVYDPNREELFEGIVGEGAWLNGKSLKAFSFLSKEEAILCTGFPTGRDFSKNSLERFVQDIQSYKKIRLFGSAALSLAYVTCGRADAYYEDSIALWDVAAGLALVAAIGTPIDYQKTENPYRFTVKAGIV